MSLFSRLMCLCIFLLSAGIAFAGSCASCTEGKKCHRVCEKCCDGMGGVSYCDSSAGRLVCKDGSYSSCYCDRHAVMDLEHLQGCCLWQGGVMDTNEKGLVICNDGGVSAVCSDMNPPEPVASF